MAAADNRRIAKNTLFLFIRMIIVMGVTLYTSRVVLNVLGFDEYGLYNLVAGIVVLFTFLNGSMTATSQRYLCVGIGRDDIEYQRAVFRSSIKLHFAIAVLFLIIAEPLGLWMIYHVLKIPAAMHLTAVIVFQVALATSVVGIILVPFNAVIIAHEKMDFYAYTSIAEASLKLLILVPLIYISGSKVIIYSLLVLGVQGSLLLWYAGFVRMKFKPLFGAVHSGQGSVVKEMIKFTGWSNFSSIANISARQGFGIIANTFLGVVVNAAIGLMNQVTTAVYTFINNFQTAINPPLIKLYASGEWTEMRKLFSLAAKFSFYLMLILALPLIFNIDSVLVIWLKNVPPFTSSLCICALISLLPNAVGGPVWTVIQATGKIQRYQIIIGIIIFSNLPADWVLLKLGFPPYVLLLYTAICNLAVVLVGLYFLTKWEILDKGGLIKELGLLLPATAFASGALMWGVRLGVDRLMTAGIAATVVCAILGVICVGATVYFIGLSPSERKTVRTFVKRKRGRE